MAVTIYDEDFSRVVLGSEIPVVVFFLAPWCSASASMIPIIGELEAELENQVKFVHINIDDNPLTPNKFGVSKVPLLKLFFRGSPVLDIVGVSTKEELLSKLKQSISQ